MLAKSDLGEDPSLVRRGGWFFFHQGKKNY